MKPGEYFVDEGQIPLNENREQIQIVVANSGDRPVQIGSHYHFYEANGALNFDREKTLGFRLDIAAGTAVRFEPGQERQVTLVKYAGQQNIYGFNGKVMGNIDEMSPAMSQTKGE